jgi:CBS domain-containing protein
MRASDLQVTLPLVRRETTALEAARLIARERLAALVVADDAGVPVAVVSSADVLGLMVPGYVLDDMSLAGVLDEAGADEMWTRIGERTIGDLLDDDSVNVREITQIDADANLVEVAAMMVDTHSQIAVVGRPTPEACFVTLPTVMDAIVAAHRKGAARA